MNESTVGKTLHYFRKQAGLSQNQLAQLAGVGKTVVFDIEKGKLSVQLDTLLKIFDVLNIQIQLKTPFEKIEKD